MDTTLQDPLVGQVLDGRYRVDARIAVGGMATVYRAVDTRLDRVLALKVMHPSLAVDGSFVERFIREAKSVARLAHPNVVQVFDQGTDGGYVYLAMEYIAGCTLRDVLRERGALQPRAALDILEPVLAALGAAHRAGFVHRDMKPENVLIGDDGRVKVADFGLVRAVDTVTNTTGTVLGTVSYLAPEQIESGTADPRVDVYACGVMLYEMLTGDKPHDGDSPAVILYKHLHEDVPPPSAAVPGLAYELDEMVASATARTPEIRPHDAVALLAQVRDGRGRLTVEQLDAVPPQALAADHDNTDDRTSVIPRALTTPRPLPVNEDEEGSAAALNRTSRFQSPPPPPSRRRSGPRRGPMAIVVAVLLVLGLGTGIWYINSGQFTEVPPLLAKTQAQAEDRLADAGLELGKVEHAYSDTVQRGTVISSDPKAGTRIRGNDSVSLTISDGPRNVRVPALAGQRLDKARSLLKQDGLAPGMVTREFSEDVPKGSVISARPADGTKVRAGTAVALVVSKGSPIDIPDVTGSDLADARSELEDAGLEVKVAAERVTSSEFDKGQVAEQSPGPGGRAAEGDTVTLTVSKGPEMIEVPNVVGYGVDDATRALQSAGFQVDEDRGLLGLFGDTVKDQSVKGGETAPKGSTITIKIR
ncbi:Stk1 family PASTA domain-containing Ser/Thr kinase [Streptomyces sp. DH10]|uniref:Stk1 family PASTA domain-containing Ser/Thr kinase n=1 Tax=Streptomyces sp. DH10 TaxID=3040121 RepID=UPI0024411224|nr:Stk1 family PASTA domain-containing Ser/Thr kinase [Streptomyces sp. DH10]MDG9709918.1 Stk1 family PASTA domain-containing Ser/Thr kinase [Streptomyces sp. DH10]